MTHSFHALFWVLSSILRLINVAASHIQPHSHDKNEWIIRRRVISRSSYCSIHIHSLTFIAVFFFSSIRLIVIVIIILKCMPNILCLRLDHHQSFNKRNSLNNGNWNTKEMLMNLCGISHTHIHISPADKFYLVSWNFFLFRYRFECAVLIWNDKNCIVRNIACQFHYVFLITNKEDDTLKKIFVEFSLNKSQRIDVYFFLHYTAGVVRIRKQKNIFFFCSFLSSVAEE